MLSITKKHVVQYLVILMGFFVSMTFLSMTYRTLNTTVRLKLVIVIKIFVAKSMDLMDLVKYFQGVQVLTQNSIKFMLLN
jgi:uncharacterized protein (DUF983 family)